MIIPCTLDLSFYIDIKYEKTASFCVLASARSLSFISLVLLSLQERPLLLEKRSCLRVNVIVHECVRVCEGMTVRACTCAFVDTGSGERVGVLAYVCKCNSAYVCLFMCLYVCACL